MQEYLKDSRIRNAVVIYKIMSNAEVQAWLNELAEFIFKHFGNDSHSMEWETAKGDCL